MKKAKKERLVKAGWKVGTAQEFLALTDEENALIELKLSLADGVRRLREKQRLSQAELAARIGSSQSRIAKLESADPSVSLDLTMRALLSLGASRKQVAKLIGDTPTAA